jgi:restriction endonuclease S subunit
MLEPKEEVKWSTIGDLFETYSGGTPTKSNKEYYEGGLIPWLRSGEVCQKEITRTEMFITEKGLISKPNEKIPNSYGAVSDVWVRGHFCYYHYFFILVFKYY